MRNRKLGGGLSLTALLALVAVPVAVAGTGTAMAQSVVATELYQIGNGSVSKVTASAEPASTGTTAKYTVTFTTPSALVKGATVTVADPSGATTFPSSVSNYSVLDETSSATQSPASVSLASGGHAVTIALSAAIGAGSSLSVGISGVAWKCRLLPTLALRAAQPTCWHLPPRRLGLRPLPTLP
jgi:hypothetical protein